MNVTATHARMVAVVQMQLTAIPVPVQAVTPAPTVKQVCQKFSPFRLALEIYAGIRSEM